MERRYVLRDIEPENDRFGPDRSKAVIDALSRSQNYTPLSKSNQEPMEFSRDSHIVRVLDINENGGIIEIQAKSQEEIKGAVVKLRDILPPLNLGLDYY